MKNVIILCLTVVCSILSLKAQEQHVEAATHSNWEVKVITSVESIVPNGLGRSRLISANEDRDFKEFTSEQTEDDNTRNKSKRKDIRVKDFEETKLLNFYNLGGIRFQNIAANDAVISSKLTAMLAEGWDLAFVTSAVESDAGGDDGQGIFITRYIFKRKL
ncbi:hypothetical protein [Psychroserpens algicola]|uniref:DUF4177 domain-containing protein n=1 Tax=Psychroserpens algicola TaxID=1719034 RepID=A0ABT0H7F7_9FLAO|nr:hypothetical protein [Psychroserpens algicola]MCK8480304.1 hypothetical protein [Psychroserpens algicola]